MFEFREHTAELELHLRAATFPDLFVEAARAVAALMLADNEVPTQPETVHQDVTLEAPDRGALLVGWIDELVYRAETAHAVFVRCAVSALSETRLQAALHGVAPPAFQSPIKAATYHRLFVGEEDGACTATVVLDV